jgi:uncharacterized protein (TIGR03382 family)
VPPTENLVMRNILIMLRLHRCFRLLMFESSGTPIAKVFPAKGKFSGPGAKEDQMLNFFNRRRAWDDLIIVFLTCGCSGAGLTISAAMAMTVVAWKVFRRKAAEESTDRFSKASIITSDPPACCDAPESTSGRNTTARQISPSLDLLQR